MAFLWLTLGPEMLTRYRFFILGPVLAAPALPLPPFTAPWKVPEVYQLESGLRQPHGNPKTRHPNRGQTLPGKLKGQEGVPPSLVT